MNGSTALRLAAATLAAAGALLCGAFGAATPANAVDSHAPRTGVGDKYVAISYSPETRTWAAAWNYADLESARTRSLSQCAERGGKNCAFLVWSRNGCAALALNADKYSAWYGATPAEAEKGALERSGGGQIVLSQCAA